MKRKISEIRIMPVKFQRDGLMAFASLVFDDSFYLGSIGIFQCADGGYRLVYPTRKRLSKNLNIFHPINREIANEIEEAIVSELKRVSDQECFV
jgi:stage V sporulation protein G